MDPERQWIARLDPDTPPSEEELDESPLRRIPRLVAGGTVAVGTVLQLLELLDGSSEILRIAVLAAVALVVAAVEFLGRSRRASPIA